MYKSIQSLMSAISVVSDDDRSVLEATIDNHRICFIDWDYDEDSEELRCAIKKDDLDVLGIIDASYEDDMSRIAILFETDVTIYYEKNIGCERHCIRKTKDWERLREFLISYEEDD